MIKINFIEKETEGKKIGDAELQLHVTLPQKFLKHPL